MERGYSKEEEQSQDLTGGEGDTLIGPGTRVCGMEGRR